MKVSVVVPVWNPGPNLTRCLDSLLGQSMPPRDYELVLVDDGSTDGTAERLDRLADQSGDRVRLIHIPNSGWPGRPRNVGADAARSEYVQFVDNDDVLATDALQRLYDLGSSSGADIVIGKPSSNFRDINQTVFRSTVVGRTIETWPLVETLTPHKMFRTEFLRDHAIRYPEGRAPLEDQLYMMRSYVKARSVAVLADRVCYFYLRRLGSGRNAGDIALVPREYYAALDQVLDTIDAGIAPGELRDRLYERFYRVELLGRLRGPAMTGYDDDYREALVAEIRRVVTARVTSRTHQQSGAATRVQGRLLVEGDVPALVRLAEAYRAITLQAAGAGPRIAAGALRIDVEAALHWGDAPLRCERTGSGWALPAALSRRVPEADRLLDDAVSKADVELSVVSRADSSSFGTVDGLRVRIDQSGVIRVLGTVTVDPMTAMGGRPLTDGLWDLRVRLRIAGLSLGAALRPGSPERVKSAATPALLLADGTAVIPYWTRPTAALALDIGQWARSLGAQVAPSAVLERSGRGLRVDVAFSSVPGAPMPPLDLLLEPVAGTSGGVLSGRARLTRYAHGATGEVTITGLRRPGTWRSWLQLGRPGSAAPALMPWQVRVRDRHIYVERSDPTGR